MTLEFLDRYIWELEAHANELLELYSEADRDDLQNTAETAGAEERLLRLCRTAPEEVFVFLGEDPAARDRRLAKLTRQERNLLFVQARYHALQAARAMRLAASVANVKGMKYRKAAQHAAQAASQAPDQPTLSDIMRLQLPDR